MALFRRPLRVGHGESGLLALLALVNALSEPILGVGMSYSKRLVSGEIKVLSFWLLRALV